MDHERYNRRAANRAMRVEFDRAREYGLRRRHAQRLRNLAESRERQRQRDALRQSAG